MLNSRPRHRWGLIVPLSALLLLGAEDRARAGDCDGLKLCFKDSLGNGAGKPTAWYVSDKHPIRYVVNASLLAKPQAAIDAVKAAFAAYEQIPCTTLKFKYDGTSSSFSDVPGKILIYWGNKLKDSSSWIHGKAAYFRAMNFNSYQTGEIVGGYVALNSELYGWDAGKTQVAPPPSSQSFARMDIKTVLLWNIPDLLGFNVSADPSKPDLPIKYSTVLPGPCPQHKTGAQYSYFKAGTGCTRPAKPSSCPGGPNLGDMGVVGDGFFTDMPLRDGGGSTSADQGGTTPGADAAPPKSCTSSSQCASDEVCTVEGYCKKVGGGGGDDDGCNVGGQRPGAPAIPLLFGLLLLLRRRRG